MCLPYAERHLFLCNQLLLLVTKLYTSLAQRGLLMRLLTRTETMLDLEHHRLWSIERCEGKSVTKKEEGAGNLGKALKPLASERQSLLFDTAVTVAAAAHWLLTFVLRRRSYLLSLYWGHFPFHHGSSCSVKRMWVRFIYLVFPIFQFAFLCAQFRP